MESTGRRELRYPPSTNMSYSTMFYNVEGLEKDVHEPVIVLGAINMQNSI